MIYLLRFVDQEYLLLELDIVWFFFVEITGSVL
jgi:hypothetical protein